jgi:hypothetical protein
MSETALLGLSNVYRTLRWLRETVSERKVRLFACGCCRQAWPPLEDPRSLGPVEAAERFADGRATWDEVRAAVLPQHPARYTPAAVWAHEMIAALLPSGGDLLGHLGAVIDYAARALRDAAREPDWRNARRRQAALLADLLGDRDRPVMIDSDWLVWGHGTIAKMARTIYEEHRFADLPILADALEEAGCRDAVLLGHCRKPAEHARGCWLIDALLGLS